MAKTKLEEGAEAPAATEPKQISLDFGNGIVVFKTDAEEGTGFTLKVNDFEVDATVKDGHLWFYAGQPLGPTSNIRLK